MKARPETVVDYLPTLNSERIKMSKIQQPNQQVRQYALTKCPYKFCINTKY